MQIGIAGRVTVLFSSLLEFNGRIIHLQHVYARRQVCNVNLCMASGGSHRHEAAACQAIYEYVSITGMLTLETSPSNPSVRFTAFVVPTRSNSTST